MDSRAKELVRIGDSLFSKKENWDSLCQEIAEHFNPLRAVEVSLAGLLFYLDRNPGPAHHRRVEPGAHLGVHRGLLFLEFFGRHADHLAPPQQKIRCSAAKSAWVDSSLS